MPADPKPPAVVPRQPPPMDNQPVRRRYADEAVRAAQHVIDLEAAVQGLEHELAEARAEATAFRRMLEEYREDVRRLTAERDWHKQCHNEAETSLGNVASIIVQCADRIRGTHDRRLEAIPADMEAALNAPPPPPPPPETTAAPNP
jgi:chromosome segregation ATPase